MNPPTTKPLPPRGAWIIAGAILLAGALIAGAIMITDSRRAERPSRAAIENQTISDLTKGLPPGTRLHYCEDPADLGCLSELMDASLKDAATAQESYRTQYPTYTTDLKALIDEGFTPPGGISFDIPIANEDGYCMETWHSELGFRHYLSADGAPIEGLRLVSADP